MRVSTFLWHYLSRAKLWVFGTLICIGLGEICRQTGFYFASRIANVLNEHSDKRDLLIQALWYSLLFGLFIQARTLIHNTHHALDTKYTPLLRAQIIKDLFTYTHTHSVQFFTEEMSGRVGTKINRTVMALFDAKKQFESPLLATFRLGVGFYFLSQIHFVLGIALILFTLLYGFFVYLSSKKMVDVCRVLHDKESLIGGMLADTLFNYNIIKNDGHMPYEKSRFFGIVKNWVYEERKFYKVNFYMHVIQGSIRSLIQMTFLFIPLYFWVHDKISIADFVLSESLITYLTLFGMDISGSVSRFCRSVGAISDGLNFLYRPIQVKDKPDATNISVKKGNIDFQCVSFAYKSSYNNGKTKPLFKNFDLSIKAGAKVGLVGSSGSGKSSLIKLLNRYYDLDDGAILLDNQNIANATQQSIRAHIAVIEQNPALFNRTILENIRYGNPVATNEEVIRAAKKAHIHDMIMRLPNGYETKVGERGIILSGGERQRIAIARAILKDAPILILDEATSALDSESELFIQQALTSVMKNKTVIAIAHRLSTLREMDYLIVMKNGKIVETGTHAALLKKGGAYATFYRLQTQNFKRGK